MDKNYGMEIVRATEMAALYASQYQGLGSRGNILNSARKAIVKSLNRVNINGLMINDRFVKRRGTYQVPSNVGKGGPEMDVMAVALEGYNAVASGRNNATSYAAIAKRGGIKIVPNLSMYKIVVGRDASGALDIDQPPTINIKRVARALGKYIENVTVCILNQARHRSLIHEVQSCGARIRLIQEGEISGCIAAIMGEKIDVFMGYGFAPEGVMVSAAVKCLGGYFEGKIIYENDRDKDLARDLDICDFDKTYKVEDLIQTQEIAFAATGITDGEFLEGIHFTSNGALTHSFVARAETHTYRRMETHHFFDHKPVF